MNLVPTIYRAAWVLPVASDPIHQGEILVDDAGLIAAVGPLGSLDIPAEARVRELGDAILLPGLVNTHAHPELTMFRGALEDLPFQDWITRLNETRRNRLRDEDHAAGATWALVESIAGGVTTLAATEATGVSVAAMTAAGMRGIVYQEVFGPDPTSVAASMRTLELDLDRARLSAGDRVCVGVSPHAPYTVSDALYREVARFAIAEQFPIAVHIAESRVERELVTEGSGIFAAGLRARGIPTPARAQSPIDLLQKLGVLDARPLLIHAVDIDDTEVMTIAAAGCAVAHCPIANAKLGHGLAPVPTLRAAGVAVGLGTDSVGSNNRLDVLEEARVAALLQRAARGRHDLLTANDLLRMSTIDGARALGLEDRIGTLERGKQADICAVSIEAPHTQPSFDPITTLFHAARGTDVKLTVVGGNVLYDSGEHRTIDVPEARRAILAAGARIRESR